jgi:hypothetical protein
MDMYRICALLSTQICQLANLKVKIIWSVMENNLFFCVEPVIYTLFLMLRLTNDYFNIVARYLLNIRCSLYEKGKIQLRLCNYEHTTLHNCFFFNLVTLLDFYVELCSIWIKYLLFWSQVIV